MRNFNIISKKTAVNFLIQVGIWSTVSIFFCLQQYFYSIFTKKPIDLVHAFGFQISYYFCWVIFVPLIIYLANRCRIERGKWKANLSIHVLTGFLIGIIHRVISFSFYVLFVTPEKVADGLSVIFAAKILVGSFDGVVIYWLIIGVYYSFDYYRQFREHKLIAAQLETQLAQAQLQALKMQLQPHFLFNTLHAISALMDDDIKAARLMLVRLSELLRQTLDNIGIQEVPLRQELEFLKSYLEIEQTRFQDRLRIQYQINPEILDARVPNLILQPLVENAIKHGIAPRAKGGLIKISVWHETDNRSMESNSSVNANGMLGVQVSDNGDGNNKNGTNRMGDIPLKEGIGLTNTRKRLHQLYGLDGSLKVKTDHENGFAVTIKFPYTSYNATERHPTVRQPIENHV